MVCPARYSRRLVALILLSGWTVALQAQPPQPPPKAKPLPKITLEELDKAIGGPTLITLHRQDAPRRQVLLELAQQVRASGVDLRPTGEPGDINKMVSVDIDKQPFWSAMQTLAPKLGMFPQRWGWGNG